MSEDFRRRVFLPFVLPVAVLVGFLLFAVSLSRVFLAVPATLATFTAIAVAGYILLVAGLVAARPRISSTALGAGLVIAMVAVVGAGAVAASAGIRPVEHEEEGEGEEVAVEGEDVELDEEAATEIPEDAQTFVAVDIEYDAAPETVPAGEVTIAIDNQGNLDHDVTIEELGDEPVVAAEGGGVDVATITLEPGTYTYYCSVPGHRATMEGTLVVE